VYYHSSSKKEKRKKKRKRNAGPTWKKFFTGEPSERVASEVCMELGRGETKRESPLGTKKRKKDFIHSPGGVPLKPRNIKGGKRIKKREGKKKKRHLTTKGLLRGKIPGGT